MKENKHIRMDYKCEQKWELMEPTDHGRFCGSCKHEIFDFTDMNIDEIRAMFKQGIKCGKFKTEQTEELIPVELNTLKRSKYWIATIATFFGMELGKAHAQHYLPEVRCEITGQCKDTTGNTEVIPEETVAKEVLITENIKPRKISRRITSIGKYGIYRSWKFPFIKIRRRYVLGMYAGF